MSDLVSVIIPVYQMEDWLARCVESVLSQTHRELEVILVNDGSTDRSPSICDDFSLRDSRVRVIHQKNAGLSVARNTGLRIHTGSTVTFVDSDDWLAPTFIERTLSIMRSTGATVVMTGLRRLSSMESEFSDLRWTVTTLTGRQALTELIQPTLDSMKPPLASPGSACAKLYDDDAFASIRFPEGRLHEDTFTTWRILLAAETVAITSEPLYMYWQRAGSITGSGFNIKARLDAFDAIFQRAVSLRQMGVRKDSDRSFGQALDVYLQIVKHLSIHPEQVPDYSDRLAATRRLSIRTQQPMRHRLVYLVDLMTPRAVLSAIFAHPKLIRSLARNGRPLIRGKS